MTEKECNDFITKVLAKRFEEFGFDETETLLIHNNGAPTGIRVQTLKIP